MNTRIPLTPRQQSVLKFITSYIRDAGYPPSIREIVERFDYATTNAAVCHLDALVRKGYLERDPNTARGMRVL